MNLFRVASSLESVGLLCMCTISSNSAVANRIGSGETGVRADGTETISVNVTAAAEEGTYRTKIAEHSR